MANNSPDLQALEGYAGKYEKQLFSTLVNALDALNDLTVISDVKNTLNLTKLKAGKGARPYNSEFQASGDDLVYTGRKLEVLMGKRDVRIEPYKYRSTWMSEVMKSGVNPTDIPFAAYVWQQVMKELAAELNDETIYFGVDKSTAVAWATGNTYAAGDLVTKNDDYYISLTGSNTGNDPETDDTNWEYANAKAITVGLATRIADAISDGDLTQTTTGAISDTNAYDAFTAVWRALPTPYRKKDVKIYASWDSVDALLDNFEDAVGKYTERDTDIIYLPKTQKRCQVVPASWMGDSGRLIATPQANLLVGTDRVSDMNKINTDQHLRTLDAGIDFVLGTQIRDLEAIAINDQE